MKDLPATIETHEAIASVIWRGLGVRADLPRNDSDPVVAFMVDGEHCKIHITPERDLTVKNWQLPMKPGFRWNGRWRLELCCNGGPFGTEKRPVPEKVAEAAEEFVRRIKMWQAWKQAVSKGRAGIRLVVDNTRVA